MVRLVFCLLFILPLLGSEICLGVETCREIVVHKGTTIHHKSTIIDGGSFISHFHLAHDAGLEKPVNVYVEYRINYLSQRKELFEDANFHMLVRGKGHDLSVRWPTRPDYIPEKIVGVDIRKSHCSD